MTQEQKDLLRESWWSVTPIADTAAQLFYGRLFEIDPSTRPLFARTDMHAQGDKLIKALDTVIGGLDRPEDLIPTLEALGRRHVGYGVTDAQYFTVGAALLWTLEQGLGDDWTAEAAEAWSSAYTFVATTMRHAAGKAKAA